jgi:hypothetical protein
MPPRLAANLDRDLPLPSLVETSVGTITVGVFHLSKLPSCSVWIDLSRCQTWLRRLIHADASALLPDLGRSERPSIRHCRVPESQLFGEKVISTVTAFVWIGLPSSVAGW